MRPDQTREHLPDSGNRHRPRSREQQKRIISKQVFNQRLEKLGIATSKRSGGNVIQNFAQRWPWQKLCREVGNYAGFVFGIGFDGTITGMVYPIAYRHG